MLSLIPLLLSFCTAAPKYLFLGASQVYGWQLSYSNPHYPFGAYVQQVLNNTIQSDIDGVPGDCFGGRNCGTNYPPNTSPQISSITGFSDRLKLQLGQVSYTYDWVVFLGGANDINFACFKNDYSHINNQTAAQYDLVNIVFSHNPKAKILFLPTYLAPLYESKCQNLYSQFINTLLVNSETLGKKYPGQVYGFDSTPLIVNRQPSFYVDDLHLNQEGNLALGTGLANWFSSLVPTVTVSGAAPTPTLAPSSATFVVNHNTGYGDNLYVVGSFNNWDTCTAVQCRYIVSNSWNCGPISLAEGTDYQWKAISFGSFSKTACSNPLWQPGNNNSFQTKAGSQTITLTY